MDSYGSLRSVCILYGCCIHMDSVWIQYILLDYLATSIKDVVWIQLVSLGSVWILSRVLYLYGFCMDSVYVSRIYMDSVWILMDLSDLCAFCMDAVSIWVIHLNFCYI